MREGFTFELDAILDVLVEVVKFEGLVGVFRELVLEPSAHHQAS